MTTPIDEYVRSSVWDWLRSKRDFDTSKVTSNQKLYVQARKALGYKKYQRVKKGHRGIFKMIRSGSFWKQSEGSDFLPRRKHGKGLRWSEGEEKLLLELSKKYKGRELVERFNSMVTPSRSYLGVHVKLSKLKR